jgi:hypothetical protein
VSAAAEVIVIRSLADSDLGIFSAHRSSATSKQRAVALTTPIARTLLSPRLFADKGSRMDVICVYGRHGCRELRHIGKVGKNWRLGGRKIDFNACGLLDSKDFVLIRSIAHNDGDLPLMMTFVGRQQQPLLHAGIGASLEGLFADSVALVTPDSARFAALAQAFPAVPACLAIAPPSETDDPEDPVECLAVANGR